MRHFFANIVGESYRNADGADRQSIIKQCQVGEPLLLEHEPDNPHDINAIRVLRPNGEQIGYLEREFAGQVVSQTGKGTTFDAVVAGVGRGKGGLYGVALLIVVDADDDTSMVRYAHRVLGEDRTVQAQAPAPPAARRRAESEVSFVWALVIMGVVMVAAAIGAGLWIAR